MRCKSDLWIPGFVSAHVLGTLCFVLGVAAGETKAASPSCFEIHSLAGFGTSKTLRQRLRGQELLHGGPG